MRTGDLVEAGGFATLPGLEVLFQMVGAETPMTRQTFGQGVMECSEMPRSNPHLARQDH
jgi:hypothetical protein